MLFYTYISFAPVTRFIVNNANISVTDREIRSQKSRHQTMDRAKCYQKRRDYPLHCRFCCISSAFIVSRMTVYENNDSESLGCSTVKLALQGGFPSMSNVLDVQSTLLCSSESLFSRCILVVSVVVVPFVSDIWFMERSYS